MDFQDGIFAGRGIWHSEMAAAGTRRLREGSQKGTNNVDTPKSRRFHIISFALFAFLYLSCFHNFTFSGSENYSSNKFGWERGRDRMNMFVVEFIMRAQKGSERRERAHPTRNATNSSIHAILFNFSFDVTNPNRFSYFHFRNIFRL